METVLPDTAEILPLIKTNIKVSFQAGRQVACFMMGDREILD